MSDFPVFFFVQFTSKDLQLDSSGALVSFLTYMGALTFVKPASQPVAAPLAVLRVPNAVARKEFVAALATRCNLDQTALSALQAAVHSLKTFNNPDPLFRAIEKYMLTGLQNRDEIVGEDGFSPRFSDALLFGKAPADKTEREPVVGEGQMDEIFSPEKGADEHAFELKVLRPEYFLKGRGVRAQNKKTKTYSWQDELAPESSRLEQLSLDELEAETYQHYGGTTSVGEYVNALKTQVKTKYGAELNNRGIKFVWLVLRVGTKKIWHWPVGI